MAALADFDAYKAAMTAATPSSLFLANAGEVARLVDAWGRFPAMTAPTTSVALTRASDGGLNGANESAIVGASRWAGIRVSGQATGIYMLVDRLVHSGGLAGNVATTQTTNLPTAALPRYTTGEGVWAALVLWSDVGTTETSFTVSYTNQAGTSGRTSIAQRIGNTGWDDARRLFIITPQAGDTGFRSVESVTLAATTGAPGNMGIVLFKPLGIAAVDTFDQANVETFSSGGFIGLPTEIDADAHLSMIQTSNPGNNAANGSLIFIPA